MSSILELKNVHVNYGSIKALKGVNVNVTQGEIVCLIGANGAGKSTLLKSIVAAEPLVQGSISFAGEIIADASRKKNPGTDQIIARGIAMTPEGRGIFADMTVLENLEMGAFLQKDRTKILNKLDEYFTLFPILKDRRRQKAGSLSGGEQQMLSIARALMNSPRLLLLDEPALGLAPIIIKNIFESIVRISREDRVTIFLVEQNAKMALEISSKGYVMETGSIVLQDTSKSLLNNPKVREAYLGE